MWVGTAGSPSSNLTRHEHRELIKEEIELWLEDEHIAIASAGFGVSLLLVAGVLATAVKKGRISLVLLVTATLFVVVVTVGVSSWLLTYDEMRDELQHQVDKLLVSKVNEITRAVFDVLQPGLTMTNLLKEQADLGLGGLNDSFPLPPRRLISIARAFSAAGAVGAIDLLYFGTVDGYSCAVNLAEGKLNGLILYGFPPEAPVEHLLNTTCVGWDLEDRGCPKCGCGTADACREHCSATCLVYNTTNCYWADGKSHVVAYMPDPKTGLPRSGRTEFSYHWDPRVRPWFKLGMAQEDDAQLWMEPYAFLYDLAVPVPVIGVSSITPVHDQNTGKKLGVVAADYRVDTLHDVLKKMEVTPEARIFLCSLEGKLISSSSPVVAMQATAFGTGTGAFEVPNVLSHPDASTRALFRDIIERLGSFHAVLEAQRIVHFGDYMAILAPLEMQGLTFFVVISIPFDDIYAEAVRASTMALVVVLSISVAGSLFVAAIISATLVSVTRLAAQMRRVAHLHTSLDAAPSSRVLEIYAVQEAFSEVVANLTEYKQFLPCQVLDDDLTKSDSYYRRDTCMAAPSGSTVAIAFTDIVGSTTLWSYEPDDMGNALQLHNQVIRSAVVAYDGYEVKTIGDSFMVAFDTLANGVTFGLSVHQALLACSWPPSLLRFPQCAPDDAGVWGGLTVRIGVHEGRVSVDANPLTGRKDYFGTIVNTAARLEGSSLHGAVTMLEEAYEKMPPSGVDAVCHSMGSVPLKGLDSETRLVALFPPKLGSRRKARKASVVPAPGEPQQQQHLHQQHLHQQHLQQLQQMAPQVAQQLPVSEDSQTTRGSDIKVTPRSSRLSKLPPLHLPVAEVRQVLSATVICAEIACAAEWGPETEADWKGHMGYLLACVDRCSGQVNGVFGRAVGVSWTRARPQAENGLRFAAMLREAEAGRVYALGCCTGPVSVGSLGREGQRFLNVSGECVELCRRLGDVARQWGRTILFANLLEKWPVAEWLSPCFKRCEEDQEAELALVSGNVEVFLYDPEEVQCSEMNSSMSQSVESVPLLPCSFAQAMKLTSSSKETFL